jgi:hypothetical protein
MLGPIDLDNDLTGATRSQFRQPRPTSDTTVRDAGSMLAFRSVQQGNHCTREDFLYELKTGPAGGLRPPSAGSYTTITGVPASPH